MKLLLSVSAKQITIGDRVAAEFDKNDWSIGTVLKVLPTGYRIAFDYGETKIARTGEMRVIAVDRKARLKKSISLAEVRALKPVAKHPGGDLGLISDAINPPKKKLSDEISMDSRAIVKLSTNPLKVPAAKAISVKRLKEVSKLLVQHKPELLGYTKKALAKVLAHRQDDSDHHMSTIDTATYFGTKSEIRLGKAMSKSVELRVEFYIQSGGVFVLKIIVPRDNERPKLVGNSQVAKDLLKTYESLKKFLAKKYSLTFGTSQYLFSDIFVAGTDGYVLSWASKIV